jgi:hypothetical protein
MGGVVSYVLRSAVRTLAAVAALTLVSCSDSPRLHRVTGTVLYLDAPAEGATVVFQPVGGGDSLAPSGTVGADGKFKLRTHPHGEGAPAGDYVVLVTWFPPDARDQENPRNKLPARYGSPTDSPLRAKVSSGPNELEPFRLTK